jgi:NifU-like protein
MFNRKLTARIENPKHIGHFTLEDAHVRHMRLAVGTSGSVSDGKCVQLYLLVDESDGIIADVKVQVFGPPVLLGALECACELLLRKNYDQARRLSAELLDKQALEKNEEHAFPEKNGWALNLVLDAIENAVHTCMDIPIADGYVSSPIHQDSGERREYPGWKELSKKQKITVIEEVIAVDIRPYVELDAGGVNVQDLVDDREVIITYEGSCTTCYSATGSTLNAIQEILRTKIYPDLFVTPDLTKNFS